MVTSISDEHFTSVFRIEVISALKVEVIQCSEILVITCRTTQRPAWKTAVDIFTTMRTSDL
jgi:hypothetical protein